MSIALLVPYAIQLLCLVHAVKNRKEAYWYYLIIFVPYIGGLAYLIVEILPGFASGRNVRDAFDVVARKIRPSAKLGKLEAAANFAPTFENRRAYALELLECGRHEEALAVLDDLLSGLHEDDQGGTLGRIRCLYALGRLEEAHQAMERYAAGRDRFMNEDETLLKLKILEFIDPARAQEEYEAALKRHDSFQMYYYYADYLKRSGKPERIGEVKARAIESENALKLSKIAYSREWVQRVKSFPEG
jgi:hypothetical protein